MAENLPRASIVVPTINRPENLKVLLSDILNQNYENFECIVVDDGSSQKNKDIYHEIFKSIDLRFKYLEIQHNINAGPSRARNFGIRMASGHFVAFCDDDDRWVRSDHLQVAVDTLENYDGDLYFAAMKYSENLNDNFLYTPAMKYLTENKISENLYKVSLKNMSEFLSLRTLHCDTIVATKKLLFDSGLYFEKLKVAEDREFSYRLVDCSSRIFFRSEVCAELNISPHDSIFRTTEIIDQYLFAYQASIRANFFVKKPLIKKTARKTAAWDMVQTAEIFMEKCDWERVNFALRQSFLTHPSYYCVKLWLKAIIQKYKTNTKIAHDN